MLKERHYEQLYSFFFLTVTRTIISQGVVTKFLCHRMYKLVMNTCMLPQTAVLCSCYVEGELYLFNVAQ
jgi:hypothetical protein